MPTKLMCMDIAKSPKSSTNCNGSSIDDTSLFKNVRGSTKKKHFRSSTPIKNVNNTEDNKLVGTSSSQELSQLGQNECKFMLNLLKKDDSDNIDLNTQNEKLILKIANKYKTHILPIDTSQINTQEFMELNLDLVTRNLQSSSTQLDTSSKEMSENIDSVDVIVITSPESIKLKDSASNNKNGETLNETKNSTIDLEFETFNETQDAKSSEYYQDSELMSFQSMCEEMSKIKSVNDTNNVRINNRVVYFEQVNADVISCVSYMDCTSSTSKVKSVFDSTHTNDCNDISKHLAKGKRKMSNSSAKSSECSVELLQAECASLNKRSKFNNQKSHSNTTFNKLNVLNTNNYFVLTTEDEDDCVLINNEFPKVQNAQTKCAHKRLIDDSREAKKHKKEVKPIFTCTPSGQIHKDMLNLINKKNGFN